VELIDFIYIGNVIGFLAIEILYKQTHEQSSRYYWKRCFTTEYKPHTDRQKGRKMPFLSLVTVTFDLDIQTRPSDGPNTSSLWIWRKSVQRFPRYFIHKQKATHSAKNRTIHSSLHEVMIGLSSQTCRLVTFYAYNFTKPSKYIASEKTAPLAILNKKAPTWGRTDHFSDVFHPWPWSLTYG